MIRALVLAALALAVRVNSAKPKNFLIIHLDDFGYADINAYNQTSRDPEQAAGSYSPNMDQMIHEGLRFDSWYAPHPICSPSRASLLTGRYPIRTSVYPGVFSPSSTAGLPPHEITLATLMNATGRFATGSVGKWHLGHIRSFQPNDHGFVDAQMLPWSHDYCPCPCSLTLTEDCTCRPTDPPCPIYQGRTIFEQPAFLPNLTQNYASSVINFMEKHTEMNKPWVMYYTPQHTHHPQFRSEVDVNASAAHGRRPDAFGDAVVGLDLAVGRVLDWIRTKGIKDETLVFLTADNGPSLPRGSHFCGSAGALNCGKFTSWEGGQRVAGVAWGSDVKPGTTNVLASSFDIFATIMANADIPMPTDRIYDSKDLSPVLFDGSTKEVHDSFIYYGLTGKVHAVRVGQYKVHLLTASKGSPDDPNLCGPPAGQKDGVHATFSLETGKITGEPWVFDLSTDIGERHLLDSSSDEYKSAVAAAEVALVKINCYQKGDAGCDTSPMPKCHPDGTVEPTPPCDTLKNHTCTFKPWTPTVACNPSNNPFTPSNNTNCTVMENTRQDGKPIVETKASSQTECCQKCFQSTMCVASVFIASSGDCNLHNTINSVGGATGSTSCLTGREPVFFTSSSEWHSNQASITLDLVKDAEFGPISTEFLEPLTEYDLM